MSRLGIDRFVIVLLIIGIGHRVKQCDGHIRRRRTRYHDLMAVGISRYGNTGGLRHRISLREIVPLGRLAEDRLHGLIGIHGSGQSRTDAALAGHVFAQIDRHRILRRARLRQGDDDLLPAVIFGQLEELFAAVINVEVGNVIGCLTERVTEALELQITPIVSPLAKELGTHKPLNVNADLAAAALARELKPVKLIYISDVPGIMKDPSDPSTLIKSVTRTEALELIENGTVSGGMIPKIHSAIDALNAGVRKVHFIDGRLPHTLLLEIFTPDGIGTEVIREQR